MSFSGLGKCGDEIKSDYLSIKKEFGDRSEWDF